MKKGPDGSKRKREREELCEVKGKKEEKVEEMKIKKKINNKKVFACI